MKRRELSIAVVQHYRARHRQASGTGAMCRLRLTLRARCSMIGDETVVRCSMKLVRTLTADCEGHTGDADLGRLVAGQRLWIRRG
jgi:hypothetical protein